MVRLKYFRFSLRTLLCITLVAALAATIFRVVYVNHYRDEALVLERLKPSGGKIYKSAREPKWLWSQFGDNVGEKGASLVLSDTEVGDDELADIAQLTELGGLYLDRTKITDKGLENIKDMKDLVAISLRRTSITRGPPLSQMAKLVNLDLAFTNVSDIDTSGLLSLENLNLRGTHITDQALVRLGALPNLQTLDIAGSPGIPLKITDDGVAHLTKDKLPKLSKIYLYFTEVTEVGIAQLKAAFPGIVILR